MNDQADNQPKPDESETVQSEATPAATEPAAAAPRRVRRWRVFLVGVVLGVAGLWVGQFAWQQIPRDANTVRQRPTSRPDLPDWAEPLDVAGLPNLHKVSDQLYRGARPDEDAGGYERLKELGIGTVINLESFHSESDQVAGAGISGYVHIYTKTWHPEQSDVVKFLLALRNGGGPYFVHCYHGSDRTGMMCAIYRIVVQGWTKEQAVEEMTRGGFGFHGNFENIRAYVYGLDVEDLRAKSGWKIQP